MVNIRNEQTEQDDIDITTETTEEGEPELSDVEENQKDIISSLKRKLKHAEEERRVLQETLQREKADFLNARKRLEEERLRDRQRSVLSHIEELIPLCDSFEMAMSDKAVWEKADANWRKGIEGIHGQLERLLLDYKVQRLNPIGEAFDPRKHEALTITPVADTSEHDKVITVIQSGYEITHLTGTTELIRPARVAIGAYEKEN